MQTIRAARTCARAPADPVRWSTAKVSATGAIDDPAMEMERAPKYQANRRSLSTSSDSVSVIEVP